jgi:hypothetical protein
VTASKGSAPTSCPRSTAVVSDIVTRRDDGTLRSARNMWIARSGDALDA